MDNAVALCIEEEKEKCLEYLEAYYKKNKHPAIIRLRDYLQGLEADPVLLEDLERIKTYTITADEATNEPFATDA